jgi:hypothetical protein
MLRPVEGILIDWRDFPSRNTMEELYDWNAMSNKLDTEYLSSWCNIQTDEAGYQYTNWERFIRVIDNKNYHVAVSLDRFIFEFCAACLNEETPSIAIPAFLRVGKWTFPVWEIKRPTTYLPNVQLYFEDGVLHRDGGKPAWESLTPFYGVDQYWIKGKRHRDDGYAIEVVKEAESLQRVAFNRYYLCGKKVSFNEIVAYRCIVLKPLLYKLGLVRDVHQMIVEYTM